MKKIIWGFYAFFYDSILILLPYKKLLLELVDRGDFESKNIFDFGCGTGNLALTINQSQKKPKSFFGVDSCATMLWIAKIKNIFFRKTSFAYCDLNKNFFIKKNLYDAFFCINVLYALDCPDSFIKNVYKNMKFGSEIIFVNPKSNPSMISVLKENHRIYCDKPLKEKVFYLIKLPFFIFPFVIVLFINLLIKRLGNKKDFHFYNIEQISEILTKNGFKILETGEIYGGSDVYIKASKGIYLRKKKSEFLVFMASKKNDYLEYYKMRYQIYCNDIRSLPSINYPALMEKDYFDEHSFVFLISHKDDIIGGVRLIRDSPVGFLMEEEFALPKDIRRNEFLEASRVVIIKEYRGEMILEDLCEAAREWSRENNFNYWCLACQEKLLEYLIKIGWNIKILDNAKEYHNTVSVPIIRKL